MLTSQLPVDRWHEAIGDPSVADSILDHMVHIAHRFELQGGPLRKVQDRRTVAESEQGSPCKPDQTGGGPHEAPALGARGRQQLLRGRAT